MRYDIAVIGNDEAALELLCMAGSLGKRVLAILPEQRHSEWMISIALRRLVEQLLNDGRGTRLNESARRCTPGLVKRLLTNALTSEIMDYMAILERLGVDVRIGEARLLSRNSVMITSGMDCSRNVFIADNVVIGCGTRRTATHRPLGLVPSTGPESLLAGAMFPETVTILGGDQFGAGFSALLSVIGVESELITHGRADCAMQELAVATGVRMIDAASVDEYARKRSRSGRSCDVLDFRRSVGFTEHLGLADVGVEPDELGRLWCASSLETWCSGVFGIGAVVGFSADISRHPTDQARRILNRISHRIPRPHFLRNRETRLSGTSAHVSD
jgi:NAD(P) transhydrogenase